MGVCRDPADDHLLSAALSGRAAYIVSGDKDLLSLIIYQGVQILSPRDFVQRLGDV